MATMAMLWAGMLMFGAAIAFADSMPRSASDQEHHLRNISVFIYYGRQPTQEYFTSMTALGIAVFNEAISSPSRLSPYYVYMAAISPEDIPILSKEDNIIKIRSAEHPVRYYFQRER